MDKEKVKKVLDFLEEEYPEAECALHHRNVFELIVAVALSAQTTDKSVNQVTPELFEKYPDAEALSKADPADVEKFIRRIGMYKTKSKNIVAIHEDSRQRIWAGTYLGGLFCYDNGKAIHFTTENTHLPENNAIRE